MTDIWERYMSVILPGSYDPVTYGHLDIIRRVAAEEDEVYVVVFINPDKKYMFSIEDRVAMLMIALDDLENCIVSYSVGRVVDYMREHGIERIVKGYRNDIDYEYEMRQAEYNKHHGGYETTLILADERYRDFSSTRLREALRNGEDISGLTPPAVAEYIKGIKY